MKIAVDAMGGDNAPEAIVLGAYDAAKEFDVDILLIGQQDVIAKIEEENQLKSDKITVYHASEVISTDEDPLLGIRRKKDSSIVRGIELLKNKEVDAFVSAGSTGAVMSGAYFKLRTLPGILRPAITLTIPNIKNGGFMLILDGGAYMDADPKNLEQYAYMGSIYAKEVFGIDQPRVGLLNVGVEEEKGNKTTKEAYGILKDSDLHFVGNIEAREIPNGPCDVLVCDGFVGNVVLKLMEGLTMTFFDVLKEELTSSTKTKIGAALVKPAFRKIKGKLDYTEVGGAPFLGVNGACIKAHGSSNRRSIRSAIKQAILFNENNVLEHIEKVIQNDSKE